MTKKKFHNTIVVVNHHDSRSPVGRGADTKYIGIMSAVDYTNQKILKFFEIDAIKCEGVALTY